MCVDVYQYFIHTNTIRYQLQKYLEVLGLDINYRDIWSRPLAHNTK